MNVLVLGLKMRLGNMVGTCHFWLCVGERLVVVCLREHHRARSKLSASLHNLYQHHSLAK